MTPVWTVPSSVIKPGQQIYKLGWALLFFVVMSLMVCLGISRYYSHKALKNIQTARPGPALSYLDRARFILPAFIFRADLQHIHTLFGRACLDKGEGDKDPGLIQKARYHFLKAVELNPDDINAAKGLARVEGMIDPPHAGNFYKRLFELRPNGISVHYMAAAYFSQIGMTEEVKKIVGRLAMIAPYDILNKDLTKAAFFRPEFVEAVKNGLKKSVNRGVQRRNAFLALAKLSRAAGQLDQALSFYRNALDINSFRNTDGHFLNLGRLYLENNDPVSAAGAFKNCLSRAEKIEKRLGQIFQIYKKAAAYFEFERFGSGLKQKGLHSTALDLYIARAWMGAGLNALARARLIEVVSQAPSAEAYYLLALAAKNQKDWNVMELNIQKATLLSPETCKYYRVFAQALAGQGNHEQADIQRIKAGKCSKKQ